MGTRRRVVSGGGSPAVVFVALFLACGLVVWAVAGGSRSGPRDGRSGTSTTIYQTVEPRRSSAPPPPRTPPAGVPAGRPRPAAAAPPRPPLPGAGGAPPAVPPTPGAAVRSSPRSASQVSAQTPAPPAAGPSSSPTNAASDPNGPAGGYGGVGGYGRPLSTPTAAAPKGYDDVPSNGGAPKGY